MAGLVSELGEGREGGGGKGEETHDPRRRLVRHAFLGLPLGVDLPELLDGVERLGEAVERVEQGDDLLPAEQGRIDIWAGEQEPKRREEGGAS